MSDNDDLMAQLQDPLANAPDSDAEDPEMAAAMERQKENLRPVARVDNLEEIGRRRNETRSHVIKLRDYTRNVGFRPLPADLLEFPHAAMLLIVTGRGHTRPASPYPGVCLLGCFGGDDAEMVQRQAVQYATRFILPKFPDCTIRSIALDKWTLLAATEQAMGDGEYCMARMDANMEAYYATLKGGQERFVHKVEDATGKKMTKPGGASESDTTQTASLVSKNKRKKLARVDEARSRAQVDLAEADGLGVERDTVQDNAPSVESSAAEGTSTATHNEVDSKLRNKLADAQAARLPKKAKELAAGDKQLDLLGVQTAKSKRVSAREDMRRWQVRTANQDKDTVPPYPAELIPRRQAVAAVCFLDDFRREAQTGKADKEPMLRILRVYESKDEAEKHIREHLAPYLADFNVDVVTLGDWLFPCDISDKEDSIETVWRDKTLNEIMARRKEERKQVRKYEQECDDQGVNPSELFIKQAEEGISVDELYAQLEIKADPWMEGSASRLAQEATNA